MAIRLGMNAKLYVRPGGLGAGDTWVEVGNARDVTLNLETGEADVTTRANNGYKATVPTLKEASIEVELVWDTADPAFRAIQDAFFQNRTIGVAAMDGDITAAGSQGLHADMGVSSFSRKEGLEDALTVTATLKVTYSAIAPRWVTIP